MCGDLRRRADRLVFTCFFFFNDTATTEIYTLSLHDALPISRDGGGQAQRLARRETGPHAPAQIPEREVFHHQPGVLVAHAQVVRAHHGRVVDALANLVLLQETAEHVERRLLLVLAVARHLQRHGRPGARRDTRPQAPPQRRRGGAPAARGRRASGGWGPRAPRGPAGRGAAAGGARGGAGLPRPTAAAGGK